MSGCRLIMSRLRLLSGLLGLLMADVGAAAKPLNHLFIFSFQAISYPAAKQAH